MAIQAYLRVSTEDQAESGAGLAAQKDACRAWAAKQGEDVAAFFADEGVSGSKSLEHRPALLELLSGLKRGDVVLVAKRDRIARDVVVAAMVEAAANRKGCKIVSAAGEGSEDDSPAGLLMRRLIDSFSEYERAVIASRTKAALQAKKLRGERVGAIQYGYHLAADGIHLESDAAEQAVICEARRLRDSGLSLGKVAAELARQGLFSRVGRPFVAQQVKNMLAQEAA
jgi:DNA invertase Pin-like site-specific DNA recombinase